MISFYLILIIGFLFHSSEQACLSTQFDASGVCQNCDVACLTCNGGSNSNCLSCTSTRVWDSIAGTCFCKDGSEQDSPVVANCKALVCHYSCQTCNNTVSFCLTCPTSSFRSLVAGSGTCPCNSKYYDASTAICSQCHYTCKQCSLGLSTSCTDCNGVKFRTTDGSGGCKCMDKYFDSGTNELCSACNYKCLTCTTSATNCLTCGANRAAGPSCACSNGFYDDGSSEACAPCQYSCRTCTSSASCATCDPTTAFRVLVSATPYCACLDRYFQATTPSTLICSSCHPTCFQCTTSNANTACTACSSAAFRQLSSGSCLCRNGYYQTNPTTELCAACSYRCRTCSTSATNCQSCDSSLYRTLAGAACPCLEGYYEATATGLCTLCQSSCKTCTNGTQCATCDTTTKLYSLNASNLCSCTSTNYFNTTQGKCLACDVKCATCDQSSPTICLSCDASRYLLSNACPCLPFRFDNSVSVCPPCHYSCQSCNGLTLSTCLTCRSSNFRNSPSAGKCLCSTGYFDDGTNALCQLCDYKCATCSDASTCLTCDSTKFRQTPATNCLCKAAYFQNAAFNCQKCAYYCITCSDATTCDTCNSPNRQLDPVTLKCACPIKFYDDGVSQTCFACLPECKSCTNSTKCASCQISLFRSLSGTNRCPCITKYFDLSGTCTPCLYQCATCSAVATCLTCTSSSFRVKDTITNRCLCTTGYFDTGIQLCSKCSYACVNCLTSATHCTSCDTTLRTLNSNWCDCNTKYYQNGLTAICPPCKYSCLTCSLGTKCDTCDATKFRSFDLSSVWCICSDRYYDDLSNQLCKSCSYKCKTCTNATECLTCDPTKFRITPSMLCPCMDKYYDSGLNSEICLPCHYSCSTCTNSSQCLSCQTSTNHRTYDSVTKKCKCLDGFYDDGANQVCLPCVYSCTTCSTSSSHCLTCSDSTTHRSLVSNQCPCQSRYLDQTLNPVCLNCQYTCQTCLDQTSCSSCDASKHRQSSALDDLCHCMTGYYDSATSTQTCSQCHLSCLTCSTGLSCLTCDPARNRLLNSSAMYDGSTSNYCICSYGLYSPGNALTCLPCHYSCQVCSGPSSSNCLYCDNSAHRVLSGTNKCSCMGGYYDDSSNQLCLPCHVECSTCIGPLNTQCKSCYNPKFYMPTQNFCYITCPNYYYNNLTTKICTQCDIHCLHCINQTNCTQCQANYYLWMSDKKCYSSCLTGFWKNTPLKLCSTCPTGCKTCISNIKCYDCIDHYYFDSTIQLCFTCNQYCKSCFGPGQDQCLTCQEPLYFKSNKCLNLTCPYGQYVDSNYGCKYCADIFPNSLTCNKNQSFLCLDTFKLKDGLCKICSQVDGYHITTQTKTCSEICGDGKLFDYQCDDGNQLDGDGCSKNCMIENGWKCTSTGVGTVSACTLQAALSLSLDSIYKFSGMNKVNLYLSLSLPYRLTNSFNVLVADTLPTDFKWSFTQAQQNLSSVSLTIQYNKNLQGKNIQISYGSSRRLLLQQLTNNQSNQSGYETKRMLTASSISFGTQIQLSTFPPVLYYSQNDFSFYQTSKKLIYYLAIILLVVSLLVVPKKTHLHSFTFSHIIAKVWLIFGLALERKLDWVNFVLHDIKQFGLIGGISMGKCCSEMSSFYGYSSELVGNSLWVLIVWIFIWILMGVIYLINKFIYKISLFLGFANYLCITSSLVLSYHIIYSSLNSLYKYSIQNPLDAFNTTLSISIAILIFVMMLVFWILSYYNSNKKHRPSSYDNIKIKVSMINTNQTINNLKDNNKSHDQLDINNNNKMLTKQPQFLNYNGNFQDLNSHSPNLQQNQVQQNLSAQIISPASRIINQSSPILTQSSQAGQSSQSSQASQSQIQEKQMFQNQNSYSKTVYQSQNTSNFVQSISNDFFKWDYIDLYNQNNPNSKYFVPITFTLLYVSAILIVFLAPYDSFVFILAQAALQIVYTLYMLIQRPFQSNFTNFRIIFVSLMFLAMEGIMAYYLYWSKTSDYYKMGQVIFIYLSIATFIISITFCLLQHLISWKQQLWNLIQPILISLRLRGVKKVYDGHQTFNSLKTKQQSSVSNLKQKDQKEQKLSTQKYDPFYMRMLKKQKINKKFRKQRKMKESIYSPY